MQQGINVTTNPQKDQNQLCSHEMHHILYLVQDNANDKTMGVHHVIINRKRLITQ
jgi:hypothetical protein